MDKKRLWRHFLWDVFICSLGAYGGPEAHYGIFIHQLVEKKAYLSDEDFVELMALTQILPGPSSTQTIVAIGHKIGGPILALMTLLIWALPALTIMALLSFLADILDDSHLSMDIFRFIGPIALSFLFVAAYRLGKKLIIEKRDWALFLLASSVTVFFRQSYIFPLLLLVGAFTAIYPSKEKDLWNRVNIKPSWIFLILFISLAIGPLLLRQVVRYDLLDIFESFYRYGYLVIGGGQVVVPLMNGELVEVHKYMSQEEFLRGFGLVQGLPGPMFSFAAYAGGLAARGQGVGHQLRGALLGGVGIFLPGTLLIFFVYPLWDQVKKIRGIQLSLKGVGPVAAGLVLASGIHLLFSLSWNLSYGLVFILGIALLLSKRLPPPILVGLLLILGYFLPR